MLAPLTIKPHIWPFVSIWQTGLAGAEHNKPLLTFLRGGGPHVEVCLARNDQVESVGVTGVHCKEWVLR